MANLSPIRSIIQEVRNLTLIRPIGHQNIGCKKKRETPLPSVLTIAQRLFQQSLRMINFLLQVPKAVVEVGQAFKNSIGSEVFLDVKGGRAKYLLTFFFHGFPDTCLSPNAGVIGNDQMSRNTHLSRQHTVFTYFG